MFRRIDPPKDGAADPLLDQAIALQKESDKLEAQGDVAGSTKAYLQSLDLQRTMPSLRRQQSKQGVHDCSARLPHKMLAHVFRFLAKQDVTHSILPGDGSPV